MKEERKVFIAYAGESAKSVAPSVHGRIAASCQDLALQMELIGLSKETIESAEFIKHLKEADCAVLVETPADSERQEWRRFLAMSVQLGIGVLQWVRELREKKGSKRGQTIACLCDRHPFSLPGLVSSFSSERWRSSMSPCATVS